MKPYLLKPKLFLFSSACILLIASLAGVMATKPRGVRAVRPQTGQVFDKLPPVLSKVSKIEVIAATIEKRGQPDAVAAIEVRNNSPQAVLAIALESGDENNFSGINLHGYGDPDNPLTIIEPRGSIKIHWAVKEILPDSPLRIAGVFYADGTEEGDATTLQAMRNQRAHSRAARGGGPGQ